MYQVTLPSDCRIRLFTDITVFPTTLLAPSPSSSGSGGGGGGWVSEAVGDCLSVTCLIDLAHVVSLFHLETAIYRTSEAARRGEVKSSSFLVDLCYQLGGNKNIPYSVSSFSPSPSTTSVAAVSFLVHSNSVSAEERGSALTFEQVCQRLLEAGARESPDHIFPAQLHAFNRLSAEALHSIAKAFKLTGAELSSDLLEKAVLTKVATKEC